MIYLLYGANDFSLQEHLSSLKEEVQPAEMRDVNTTVLEGPEVGPDELVATCNTVPFLADKRIVIVRGLLSMFDRRASFGREPRGGPSSKPTLGQWEALPEYLPTVPETTELVFVDGRLSESNPLLAKIRPLVEIRSFTLLRGGELRRWIRQRATKLGTAIEPRAVEALASTIGADLRVIDLELQKLSLYRWGQSIGYRDVQELVSYTKEGNIFAAVDAVLEGRSGTGIELVHGLLDLGRPPSYVIAMMARQVRLLLVAKELRAQGLSSAQIGPRLSLSGYPLRKTLEQEVKFTSRRLAEIHHKLLETDLNIKKGALDERLALDMLMAELASAPGRG